MCFFFLAHSKPSQKQRKIHLQGGHDNSLRAAPKAWAHDAEHFEAGFAQIHWLDVVFQRHVHIPLGWKGAPHIPRTYPAHTYVCTHIPFTVEPIPHIPPHIPRTYPRGKRTYPHIPHRMYRKYCKKWVAHTTHIPCMRTCPQRTATTHSPHTYPHIPRTYPTQIRTYPRLHN